MFRMLERKRKRKRGRRKGNEKKGKRKRKKRTNKNGKNNDHTPTSWVCQLGVNVYVVTSWQLT